MSTLQTWAMNACLCCVSAYWGVGGTVGSLLVLSRPSKSQPGHTYLKGSQPGHTSFKGSQPGHTSLKGCRPGHTSLKGSQPGHTSLRGSRPGHTSLWRGAYLVINISQGEPASSNTTFIIHSWSVWLRVFTGQTKIMVVQTFGKIVWFWQFNIFYRVCFVKRKNLDIFSKHCNFIKTCSFIYHSYLKKIK